MSSFSCSPSAASAGPQQQGPQTEEVPPQAHQSATDTTLLYANGFTTSALGIRESMLCVADNARVKVYCLSDLHVDTGSNLAWVEEHCRRPRRTPGSERLGEVQEEVEQAAGCVHVFVCAGDVSGSLDGFEAVFTHLVEQYDAVCFVPGNHDVWCKNGASQGKNVEIVQIKSALSNPAAQNHADSVQKLQAVLALASRLGVHTGPLRISRPGVGGRGDGEGPTELRSRDLVIAPLYAWYHADWDTEPEITDPDYLKMQEMMPFSLRWLDFSRCTWPEWLVSEPEFRTLQGGGRRLARAFASLNDPFIPALASAYVSIEKRFLIEPMLTKVIGSCELESQIRCIKPQLHLFGHTHIPIDVELEGVRYVQWPLGYFREGTMQCEPVRRLNSPMMVYDSDLLDEGDGIPRSLPSSRLTWSARYAQPGSRTPHDVTPSPWLRDKINAVVNPPNS